MEYFNPRSREGSDFSSRLAAEDIVISIHAPARGATNPVLNLHKIPKISIHAPARGATLITDRTQADITDFNPRSREGSDGKIFGGERA